MFACFSLLNSVNLSILKYNKRSRMQKTNYETRALWELVSESQKQKCITYSLIIADDRSHSDLSHTYNLSLQSIRQIKSEYDNIKLTALIDCAECLPSESGQYLGVIQYNDELGHYTEQTQVYYNSLTQKWSKKGKETEVIKWTELVR